jgi:hypothetical protein
MMERIEKMRVSDDAPDLVFRKARTYSTWLPKPVPEELLRQLYDTLKWGPRAQTSVLRGSIATLDGDFRSRLSLLGSRPQAERQEAERKE